MHDDSPETLVTLTFKENAGTTTLTLLHEHFISKESADRHHYGHSGGLDKLENDTVSEHPVYSIANVYANEIHPLINECSLGKLFWIQ